MDLASAGATNERNEPAGRRAANDRVVDHHNTLALQHLANGVVLHFYLGVATGLRRLNECSSDVVISNERQLVRQPTLLREPERGGVRRIGNAEHEVSAGCRVLARQLLPEGTPRTVDRAAEDAAVGTREVHKLEHALP